MPNAFLGRRVFPIAGQSLEDGVVLVDDGQIVEVGQQVPAGAHVVDLNERAPHGVAILPGLINAHTHLEFSSLSAPLGQPGMRFPNWIRQIIAHRQNQRDSDLATDNADAFQSGLRECVANGTSTLGEIVKPETVWQSFSSTIERFPCDVTNFLEFLGLADDRHETVGSELEDSIARLKRASPRWHAAISPHAPYSTHWKLGETLCGLACQKNLPVAMHVAESPEELELLRSHSGPFRDLLQEIGVWNPDAVPRGAAPIDYLRQLANVPRSLVVHGNYLSLAEIEFVAGSRGMSVVYCPRTHTYFQHSTYPLHAMISASVNVALGTDSRASNPDLALMREMQHVAAKHPDVTADQVLRMGTINGAMALGCDSRVGTLEPGKDATMALFSLSAEDADAASLLNLQTSCVGMIIRGQMLEAG